MRKQAARGTTKRTQESPKEQRDELGGSLRRSARLHPTSSPGSPQLRSNPASFTKKPKIQVLGHAKSPWGFPELFPRSSTKPVLTPCTLGLHSSKMVEKPSIVTHQDAAASEPADEEGSSSSNLSPGKRNQAIINDIIASVGPQLFGSKSCAMRGKPGGISSSTLRLPIKAAYRRVNNLSEKGPTTALKRNLLLEETSSIQNEGSNINSRNTSHSRSLHLGTAPVVAAVRDDNVVTRADSTSTQCQSFGFTELESMCANEVDGLDEEDRPAFVTVHGYLVNESSAPILRSIISKYGDIAARYTLTSSEKRSRALESVCECFYSFKGKKLQELNEMIIEKALVSLHNLRTAGMEVSWLFQRLEQILKAKQLMAQVPQMKEARSKCDEVFKQKQAQLMEMERRKDLREIKLQELQREMEEVERKLQEKKREKEELERELMEEEKQVECAKLEANDAYCATKQVGRSIADVFLTMKAFAASCVMDGLLPSEL